MKTNAPDFNKNDKSTDIMFYIFTGTMAITFIFIVGYVIYTMLTS